jgi:hypothetical protein
VASDGPACGRHPNVATRVSCVQCEAPICPDCMIAAPVGFKCPDCARQASPARPPGRPNQYAQAVGYGAGAAMAAMVVLSLVFRQGFLSWIAAGFAGYLVSEAVRRGASGNRADPFRYLGYGLTVAAVAGGWMLLAGGVGPALDVLTRSPYALVTFLAALYGAWRSVG